MQSGISLLVTTLSLALPLQAQSITPLLLEGDVVPGVGAVVQIDNLAILDGGGWLVEARTDNPDGDVDSVVVRDGVLLLREGQFLIEPAGAQLDTFDSLTANAAGDVFTNFVLAGTSGGTSDNAGVYRDDQLLIQEGAMVGAAGFGPGTIYVSFGDVQGNDVGQVYLRGFADDPAIPATTDYFAIVVQVDGTGNVVSETLFAKETDIPPGQTEMINTIRTGPHAGAFNNVGDVIWCADLMGDDAFDAVAYRNQTLLAQQGLPSPVAGRTWGDLVSPEVDVNDAGDWTLKDKLDNSDTTTDDIIVKNGVKFRQEGDTLPAIAPFAFRGNSSGSAFGNGAVDLTDDGRVLHFGRWNDPDTTRDDGLFLNETLLVQEGVTTVGGVLIDDVGDQSENYFISPDGAFVIFEATLADGREGAFRIQLEVGTSYCVAGVNSTGAGGEIAGQGDASVSSNALTLVAAPLPVGVNGLFYYGQNAILTPFGDGFRCVGGATFRLQITSATGGILQHALDVQNPPAPAGQITAGATWRFQAWYRDPQGPLATGFNLSDGLEVLFLP